MQDVIKIIVGPEAEPEPERPEPTPEGIVTTPITARSDKAARRKWWKQANKLGFKRENKPKIAPPGGVKGKKKAKRKAADKSRKTNRK